MSYMNKNAKRWAKGSLLARYGGALLITLVAFAIRKTIHPYIQPHAPFQFVIVASIITEFFAGIAPAILSLTVGMVLGAYFFVMPFNVFDGVGSDDVIVVINNLSIAIISVILLEYLRRAQYSTRLTFNVINSQRRSLLEVYNQVLYQQRKSKGFVKEMTSVFSGMDDILLMVPLGQPAYRMPAWYRLTGDRHGDDGGSAWRDAIHPEDRAALEHEIDAAGSVPVGNAKALRFRVRSAEGDYRWVDTTLRTIQYRQQWRMTVLAADRTSLAQGQQADAQHPVVPAQAGT